MKIVYVLIPVICLAAFAGFTEFGAHGGIMLPSGDAGDSYELSPLIGVNLLVHMPNIAVEGSASYVFLGSNLEENDWSAYMVPIIGGVRSYTGNLFLGGGGGLYLTHVEWLADTGTVSSSDTDLGAYGNAGTIIHLGGTDLEASAKLHWVAFDTIWFSLTAGIYF